MGRRRLSVLAGLSGLFVVFLDFGVADLLPRGCIGSRTRTFSAQLSLGCEKGSMFAHMLVNIPSEAGLILNGFSSSSTWI
jgi:hypothetical protein